MFEYYNNTLCVHGRWLYEFKDGVIMSQANYKYLKSKYLKALQKGGNGRKALIAYDSIPERFKMVIEHLCGNPYEFTKRNRFVDQLEEDIKAREYFQTYTLDSGDALPKKNIEEYIANASILNTAHHIMSNLNARRRSMGGSKSTAWDKIADVIKNLPRHTWKHSIPENPTSLKRKTKKYKAEGYESLIHRNFCNKNSEKISDDAKIWLLNRWADQFDRIATIEQLHGEYNSMAKEQNWKALKEKQTIRLYLFSEDIQPLWYGHRYGELKAKEKFAYQHSTKLPSKRDALWYSDGTKMNYYYLNDQGKISTCQVYEVMDAFSEVLLGFHISKTEDFEAQYKAYKMAVQVAEHRPYQLGFDNQGGHKKLENGNFLTKLARLSIKTQPYNGKSKTIENAFGRFQMQYMKRDWFFTGQNITTKEIESKANMELIMANKENLPTLSEVKKVYEKRRKEWNSGKHPQSEKTRINTYFESVNELAPAISTWDMVDLFWIERPKPIQANAYGIQFTENKVKHNYMVNNVDGMPNVEWLAKNIDKKFTIKFDPEDMSMIYLYEDTPLGLRFVTEASIKVQVHRAIQDQEDGEAEFIKQVLDMNKKLREETYEEMESILDQYGASAQARGMNKPKLKGINSKRQRKAKESHIGKHLKEESNQVFLSEDSGEIDIYDII